MHEVDNWLTELTSFVCQDFNNFLLSTSYPDKILAANFKQDHRQNKITSDTTEITLEIDNNLLQYPSISVHYSATFRFSKRHNLKQHCRWWAGT